MIANNDSPFFSKASLHAAEFCTLWTDASQQAAACMAAGDSERAKAITERGENFLEQFLKLAPGMWLILLQHGLLPPRFIGTSVAALMSLEADPQSVVEPTSDNQKELEARTDQQASTLLQIVTGGRIAVPLKAEEIIWLMMAHTQAVSRAVEIGDHTGANRSQQQAAALLPYAQILDPALVALAKAEIQGVG